MAQVNFTIVGLGKIGGSFGLALKAYSKQPNAEHQFSVTGYDGSAPLIDQALKLGVIDKGERNLSAAVERADLVFLDLPYSDVESALELIGSSLKAGAVVMDASPLKMPSIDWAQSHFRTNANGEQEAYLVGVHLLLGADHLGDYRDTLDAARADLFTGGLMILAPSADCPQEAVQLVADVATLLGFKQHFADPNEHDGILTAMESLPLLLQLALFRTLNSSKSWEDLRMMGNTSFYLGTYQLSQNDPEALGKQLYQSRDALLRRLDDTLATLNELRDVLRSGDELAIGEAFDQSITAYTKWERTRRSNEWLPIPSTPVPTEGMRLFGGLFGRKDKKKTT